MKGENLNCKGLSVMMRHLNYSRLAGTSLTVTSETF